MLALVADLKFWVKFYHEFRPSIIDVVLMKPTYVLRLDEAVASRTVFVIVSGSGGRTESFRNALGTS